MKQHIQFVGFSMQKAERFLKKIVSTCIDEHHALQKNAEVESPSNSIFIQWQSKIAPYIAPL